MVILTQIALLTVTRWLLMIKSQRGLSSGYLMVMWPTLRKFLRSTGAFSVTKSRFCTSLAPGCIYIVQWGKLPRHPLHTLNPNLLQFSLQMVWFDKSIKPKKRTNCNIMPSILLCLWFYPVWFYPAAYSQTQKKFERRNAGPNIELKYCKFLVFKYITLWIISLLID